MAISQRHGVPRELQRYLLAWGLAALGFTVLQTPLFFAFTMALSDQGIQAAREGLLTPQGMSMAKGIALVGVVLLGGALLDGRAGGRSLAIAHASLPLLAVVISLAALLAPDASSQFPVFAVVLSGLWGLGMPGRWVHGAAMVRAWSRFRYVGGVMLFLAILPGFLGGLLYGGVNTLVESPTTSLVVVSFLATLAFLPLAARFWRQARSPAEDPGPASPSQGQLGVPGLALIGALLAKVLAANLVQGVTAQPLSLFAREVLDIGRSQIGLLFSIPGLVGLLALLAVLLRGWKVGLERWVLLAAGASLAAASLALYLSPAMVNVLWMTATVPFMGTLLEAVSLGYVLTVVPPAMARPGPWLGPGGGRLLIHVGGVDAR